MKSVSEQIEDASETLKELALSLLKEHSSLIRDREVNNSVGGVYVVSISGDHTWQPLNAAGKQLQSRIREEYGHFVSLLKTLLQGQPPEVISDIEEAAGTVLGFIDQNHYTWCKTTEEANQKLTSSIDEQVGHLGNLYDSSEGRHVYVPDTNALLYNTNLETWSFADSPKFELVLTPTVISELDQLKVNHRNENVRNKAEGLVRRIKGYRTRGRLSEGIPLLTNRSTLRTIAVEPDMATSLPWLKPENADDRILASFIEVMRRHPRSVVVLVSRDINLQNKAEFARLLFVEPPDESP